MIFDKLNIELFKGVKARGYLSGNLYTSNNDSTVFSNAKIEKFSYKEFSNLTVDMEGSFSNNELVLSDLEISKQIGLLNVSGSFTSLDNFYNKIINKLKFKLKD